MIAIMLFILAVLVVGVAALCSMAGSLIKLSSLKLPITRFEVGGASCDALAILDVSKDSIEVAEIRPKTCKEKL